MTDVNEIRKKIIHLYDYNPLTGTFTSRLTKNVCGARTSKGYLRIGVGERSVFCHRAAFLIMEGRWPEQCDHINRVRDDNRWTNLRESNQIGNAQNHSIRCTNTSGTTGVSFIRRWRWVAEMTRNGIRARKKSMASMDEAILARRAMELSFEAGIWPPID